MYFYFTLRSYYWGSLPHMSLKHRIFDPTVQIVILFVFLTSRWLYRVLVSKDWLMPSQISLIGYVCVYIVNHKFPWIYSRFDSWFLVLPRENWSNWSLKQKKEMFLHSFGQLVILTTWSLDSHRYKLMLQCWDQEPSRRPTFESITSWMENLAHPHCTESRNTSQIISWA